MSVANFQARKRLKKYLKATEGRGWNIRLFDPEWNPERPTYLYAVDAKTGYVRTYALENAEFTRWADQSQRDREMADAAQNAVGGLVADLADGKLSKHDEGQAIEVLGKCLAAYAGITKTYALHRDWTCGHFVVLIYRFAETLLRPVGRIGKTNEMLDADDLAEFAGSVITMDQVAHPEWFGPAAVVLPFRDRS